MSKTFLKLAVIGDPIEHSKSPQLHQKFLVEANRAGSYEAIRVPSGQVREMLKKLHTSGYAGLNVTTPLKEEVLEELVDYDELVGRIGAANTLIAKPNGWYGANTDGQGLCKALQSALPSRASLSGLRVLVLGIGPTARAVIANLLDAKADVAIWNRTHDRAIATAVSLDAKVWETEMNIDAVVATLPPDPILPEHLYDLMRSTRIMMDVNYGPRATLQQKIHRPIIDGFEMLKQQAQASFQRWIQEFGEGEI